MSAPGFNILTQVSWDEICSETVRTKFKGRARQWSAENLKHVRSTLRKNLLADQRNRCAYCRRLIQADLGKHEVDHIAPCSTYPEFTYTRINLVATCKRCNWHKREHDTLSKLSGNRRTLYTTSESTWNWLHPYIHHYDDHIKIVNGMIFTPKPGISGKRLARAQNMIQHCGLSTLKSAESIAMVEIARADIDDWTAALRIIGNYPDVPALRIARILKRTRQLPAAVEEIRDAILEIRGYQGRSNVFLRKTLSK